MATVYLNAVEGRSIPRGLLRRGVREALKAEGISSGEISVTFLDDERIRALNRDYLRRDLPTDVIAFALHQPGEPVLGDVYVGFDQARRQADELGVALEEELLRLVIHGVLHVLGHEHPEGRGREQSPMFLRQEELLHRILSPE